MRVVYKGPGTVPMKQKLLNECSSFSYSSTQSTFMLNSSLAFDLPNSASTIYLVYSWPIIIKVTHVDICLQ